MKNSSKKVNGFKIALKDGVEYGVRPLPRKNCLRNDSIATLVLSTFQAAHWLVPKRSLLKLLHNFLLEKLGKGQKKPKTTTKEGSFQMMPSG